MASYEDRAEYSDSLGPQRRTPTGLYVPMNARQEAQALRSEARRTAQQDPRVRRAINSGLFEQR
jgi:hypothetical protein